MATITGMIKLIKPTEKISEKFSKREIVVTDNSMYPQDILIQFTQDKCAVLDGYKEMDHVAIDINIRGREWTSPKGEVKYFNTLEGWKIAKTEAMPTGASTPPIAQATEEEDDLLPF